LPHRLAILLQFRFLLTDRSYARANQPCPNGSKRTKTWLNNR